MTEKKRALVVVDTQIDVLAPCLESPRIIATIGALVDNARAAGVPVIWVRHHSEDLLQDSPGWQIVPELTPAPGEAIVEKTYGDAFADTDLVERLGESGAEVVILCGAQSDACIRSTFYGSLYRGFDVTLVSDAHTTEDMRPWGVHFAPEQAIEMINAQAQYTRLPGVTASVMTAGEVVFAG